MTDFTRENLPSHHRIDLQTVDAGKAIRRARLHSAVVKHVRLLIIVSSTLAIVALGIIAFFDPFKRLPGKVTFHDVGMQGSRVTLKSPKMAGMRSNGRPFELQGISGIQDVLKPNLIELSGVKAKIVMDDLTTSRITASDGLYDSGKDVISLKGHVHIINDSGYDLRMPSATVNVRSSSIITNEPVVVLLNGGRVVADRMDIEDDGHKISFDGDVHSTVDSSFTVDLSDSGNGDPGSGQAEAQK